jgi:hypothetical protein
MGGGGTSGGGGDPFSSLWTQGSSSLGTGATSAFFSGLGKGLEKGGSQIGAPVASSSSGNKVWQPPAPVDIGLPVTPVTGGVAQPFDWTKLLSGLNTPVYPGY